MTRRNWSQTKGERFGQWKMVVVAVVAFTLSGGCDRGASETATGAPSSETTGAVKPESGDDVSPPRAADSSMASDAIAKEVPADPPAQESMAKSEATDPLPRTDNANVKLGADELFAGIPGSGALTQEQIQAWLDDPANHETLAVRLPMGLAAAASAVKGVDENPITRAKIELGRQLYFDTRLSIDATISCASCHDPENYTAKETPFGVGIDGQEGARNSPVAFNRIISDVQFWDGRAATLEEQAKGPIENPIEMANTHENAIKTVKAIPGYVMQFEKIFPDDGATMDTIAKAIATFERAIVTGPAPYDYLDFVKSLESQMDEEEIAELEEDAPELFQRYTDAKRQIADLPESVDRGRELFFSERANCTACHAGANFSDEQYHNLGVGMAAEKPDLGRFEISHEDADRGAFKTPTVRNVSKTGPYMHDGSQKTLMDVVQWYDVGGHANPHLSDKIKILNLTEQEKLDLVDFMEIGLLGSFPKMETGRLP